jgi:hypothetical protein
MKTMRKTQTIVEIIEPDVMANPMRPHCQFTVKRSPKCAVRDAVETT